MTFGEHLEELRGALIKALSALVFFVLIGLFFAGDVVDGIQAPLREGLLHFYQDQGKRELAQRLAAREGRTSPNDADLAEATRIVEEEGFLSEERYIDRKRLLEILDFKEHRPTAAKEATGTKESQASSRPWREKDLVKVLLYFPADKDPRIRVIGLSVHEAFTVWIKAAFLVGVLLASPLIFYFIWEFVAAGLYPHEKHYVHVFLPFSLALFIAGALLAFYAVMGFILDFLFPFYALLGIDPDPRIGEWLSFVLILPVGFGISFQLPLVMLFLERIGIFTIQSYLSKWRISILVIFTLSMLLTPADPWSMILMAIPLTALYFGGIALCHYLPKQKTPFGNTVE
ncbi:MAG: twin-arginine translocase subunit TatC [Pirellulales bacterium]|nr:twin-arginine translocase subunit TatC [Pirellulales bacterium]